MKQLFKYMREPRDLFQSGYIRLSQPAVLHDPFEATYCQEGLDRLAGQLDHHCVLDPELGEVPFSSYVNHNIQHIGIISLSASKTSLMMWACYADEHRGLVAGIASHSQQDSIFASLLHPRYLYTSAWEGCSRFTGRPEPVSYRRSPRYHSDSIDCAGTSIDAEGSDRILYEIFMQKSDEWIHEQEYRVVLRLEQADRVVIPGELAREHPGILKRSERYPQAFSVAADGTCTIDLCAIADPFERMFAARGLARLSQDPRAIYLMQLSASAINHCILGLRSELDAQDIDCSYARSSGPLHLYRAARNPAQYDISFQGL